MAEPYEAPDLDLDSLTRAELAEVDPMAATVARVLDDLRHRAHGIISSSHHAGLFLDLLAVEGYRVTPVEVPALADVLPVEVPGG